MFFDLFSRYSSILFKAKNGYFQQKRELMSFHKPDSQSDILFIVKSKAFVFIQQFTSSLAAVSFNNHTAPVMNYLNISFRTSLDVKVWSLTAKFTHKEHPVHRSKVSLDLPVHILES